MCTAEILQLPTPNIHLQELCSFWHHWISSRAFIIWKLGVWDTAHFPTHCHWFRAELLLDLCWCKQFSPLLTGSSLQNVLSLRCSHPFLNNLALVKVFQVFALHIYIISNTHRISDRSITVKVISGLDKHHFSKIIYFSYELLSCFWLIVINDMSG